MRPINVPRSGVDWHVLDIFAEFGREAVGLARDRTGRPFWRVIVPWSASHSRAADSTSVCSTVCRSKVERLMTLSTSAVAVCCCSDSRSSLSRRVFSMAMTAWAAKFVHQLDLLVGERSHLLAIDGDGADQLVLLEHRHGDEASRAADSLRPQGASAYAGSVATIGDVDHLLRVQQARPSRSSGLGMRTRPALAETRHKRAARQALLLDGIGHPS